MTPAERYALHKDDPRYNTSYPLRPEDWAKYRVSGPLSFDDARRLSFYLHIPFCKSLCKFCEYVRYAIPDESTQLRYLDIVWNDMANFINSLPDDVVLEGFDIGGGTPTALAHKAFAKLLLLINDHADFLDISNDFAGSIEASFNTIDEEKIALIGQLGRYVKRISFGLQNVGTEWLKEQNRSNGSRQHMLDTIQNCRQAGIDLINIDLMYGFMGQSVDSFTSTLDLIGELRPEHLTLYELRTNMLCDKRCASAGERFDQYTALFEAFTAMGYTGRFGCNTFSLIGDDGVSSYLHHRMVPDGFYKGFGISAQSKSDKGISYNAGKRPLPLAACLDQGTFEIGGDTYLLPPEEMAAKYIAICGYCGRFSISRLHEIGEREYKEELHFLTESGLITVSGDIATISSKGFKHYGAVFSIFYPNE